MGSSLRPKRNATQALCWDLSEEPCPPGPLLVSLVEVHLQSGPRAPNDLQEGDFAEGIDARPPVPVNPDLHILRQVLPVDIEPDIAQAERARSPMRDESLEAEADRRLEGVVKSDEAGDVGLGFVLALLLLALLEALPEELTELGLPPCRAMIREGTRLGLLLLPPLLHHLTRSSRKPSPRPPRNFGNSGISIPRLLSISYRDTISQKRNFGNSEILKTHFYEGFSSISEN